MRGPARALLAAAMLAGWPQGDTLAQNTRALGSGATSPPADIEMFAWMAGRWTGSGLGKSLEEVYSPPRAGMMVAHFAGYSANGVEFMEFITLAKRGKSLVLRIRHFQPDMIAWEDKEKWVEFPFVGHEGNRYYFDGLTIEHVSDRETIHYILLKDNSGKVREMKTHYFRAGTK